MVMMEKPIVRRFFLEGAVLELPKCGCTIEGEGTLIEPLKLLQCAAHAPRELAAIFEATIDEATGTIAISMSAETASLLLGSGVVDTNSISDNPDPDEARAGRMFYEALCEIVDKGNVWREKASKAKP